MTTTRPPLPSARPARHRLAVLAVLAYAAAVAFLGLTALALDSHEILVVQTAAEMRQRGDWIVPYYNGAPRLEKPPLSYWLTAGAARALGSDSITALHGRVPSAISAVVLVAATIGLGRRLFGRSVGLGAGVLIASTYGYVTYAHSARSEMLYAALCAAGLAFFVHSWRSPRGREPVWSTAAMWSCMGLACLAKGPHVPALLVAGMAAVLLAHRPSRPRLNRVLRPAWGLPLAIAIAAPWWLLLRQHVGADALTHSQLMGRRFEVAPANALDPYYLWRPWRLLLPWFVLWPSAVLLAVRRSRFGYGPRALGLLVVLTVAMMSFGGGKRDYYLLPLGAPVAVLMALGLRMIWLHARAGISARMERAILLLAALLAGAFQAVLLMTIDQALKPGAVVTFVIAGVVTTLAVVALVRRATVGPWLTIPSRRRSALRIACVAVALLSAGHAAPQLHAAQSSARVEFGRAAGRALPAESRLLTYRIADEYLVYFGGHQTIPIARGHLGAAISKLPSGPETYLAYPAHAEEEIVVLGALHVVMTVEGCDEGQRWILARWQPPRGSVRKTAARAPARGRSG